MPAGAIGGLGGAALIGGATLGSSVIGGLFGQSAANKQAKAAREAQALQLRMFNESREALSPYMNAGRGATASLAQLYGIDPATGNVTGQPFPEGSLEAFRRSPDYEFARQEGQRGLEFTAAGRGALRSGNTLRDLTTFNQGLATQNFGNYRGALQQLAALGQGAAGSLAGNSTAVSQGVAGNINQAGAARASGDAAWGNALGGGLGNLGNYAMLQSLMRPSGSAYGGMSGGKLGTDGGGFGGGGIPGLPGWPY